MKGAVLCNSKKRSKKLFRVWSPDRKGRRLKIVGLGRKKKL